MNVNDSPRQRELRAEFRQWQAGIPDRFKNLPLGIPGRTEQTFEELRPLLAALEEKGWLYPAWPREHGGAGFSFEEMIVFTEEWVGAGLPDIRTGGLDYLSPILIRYGTDAQKARFLGPTLRREIIWAQGYSEPNAGSDLASLQTRADRVEGGFVVNGQKVWTSSAHLAHWLYVLVRTTQGTRRKQEGISLLLFEKDAPGITIRPITTIDGLTHFNEMFFENVFVPEDQVLGELDQGWTVAKAILGHERFSPPALNPVVQGRAMAQIRADARALALGGGVLWDDAGLRRDVAALEMEVDANRYTRYRAMSRIAGGDTPGPETYIFKYWGTELMQRILERHHGLLAQEGLVWDAQPFGRERFDHARRAATVRSSTIAGGTSEVQRNVVAKRVLGLPD